MGFINSIGVKVPRDLICPTCKNNFCLLYPEVFANQHLRRADKEWYKSKVNDINNFIELKLEEYIETIKQQQ